LSLDYTLPEQYVFISDSRRRADRLIWTGLGRAPDSEKDRPTIAVEFVSKAKRDRQRDYIEKRAEYRAIGIPEYLVFDRFRRTLSVFLVDGTERILKEDEVYNALPPRLRTAADHALRGRRVPEVRRADAIPPFHRVDDHRAAG
jgi:Uma2 family endonuclease